MSTIEKGVKTGLQVESAFSIKTKSKGHKHRQLLTGWADTQRLLAMRLDNIGDVIMTGPALRAVKQALPSVRLTLMASPAGAQASSLLPWVDDVLIARVLWQDLGALPFDPGRESALIGKLSAMRFDAAVLFTSFSQSPFPAGLACLLAGIPLRAAESKEIDHGILTNTPHTLPEHVHQVERNLHLVRSLGFSVRDTKLWLRVDDQSKASAERLLLDRGLRKAEPYILANPWASAQARTYPLNRFYKAVLELSQRSGLHVVLTGTAKQKNDADELPHTRDKAVINLVGCTTVPELAALVEQASLVITSHTSVMHMADALLTPEVVLYSGSDLQSQWTPRSTRHILLHRPMPCCPCYAFTCPERLGCLDIPPEEVVDAGLRLLNEI